MINPHKYTKLFSHIRNFAAARTNCPEKQHIPGLLVTEP